MKRLAPGRAFITLRSMDVTQRDGLLLRMEGKPRTRGALYWMLAHVSSREGTV